MAKFTLLHSKSALVTETCFVAYKIWNNFCFDTNLTPVQISAEFHKIQKRGDKGCYSDPIGITGSLSNAAAVRAAPRAPVRARSCLLACVARQRGRPWLISFSPLSTSVGAAARFLRPEPENPDELPSSIHHNHSFPSQIEQPSVFVTFVRTQCTPKLPL